MAASKKNDAAVDVSAEPMDIDEAVAQAADERESVEKVVAEAEEKGYFGETHSPFDNDEFTLRTGPDSPTALDQEIASSEARVKALKSSKGAN